eukprot:m.236896 g.236896  ORF g.236896 m.236896 type:complete len:305 (-) comp13051_c0_seq1:165-1079(-)
MGGSNSKSGSPAKSAKSPRASEPKDKRKSEGVSSNPNVVYYDANNKPPENTPLARSDSVRSENEPAGNDNEPSQPSSPTILPVTEEGEDGEAVPVVLPTPVASAPSRMPSKAAAAAAAAQQERASRLFAAPEGPQRSKIFQALNPEKLWYETRREKEENAEEKEHITIRGGGAGMALHGAVDFMHERDAEGNIIEEEEEEDGDAEEEDFDPHNLPDFGEFQEEMDALRKQRAEAQKKHQDELRQKHLERKAREEAERARELAEIEARENALKAKKPELDPELVRQAQARLEAAATEHYSTFRFS